MLIVGAFDVSTTTQAPLPLLCAHLADRGHWHCVTCGESFHDNWAALIHKLDFKAHKIYWKCADCGQVLTPADWAGNATTQPAAA